MSETWSIEEVLHLCREIEAIAPDYGAHVALTGGLLYKDGPRKDADILLYRIRQRDEINVGALFYRLRALGIETKHDPEDVWCIKATWRGKAIDFFFPDAEEGDYPPAEDDDEDNDEPELKLRKLMAAVEEWHNAGANGINDCKGERDNCPTCRLLDAYVEACDDEQAVGSGGR